jgi:hypothetical protein
MLLAGLSRRCRYTASKEFLYPLGGFYILILGNVFKMSKIGDLKNRNYNKFDEKEIR